MHFFAKPTVFLHKLACVRTAFNACGILQFCDETLVLLGHQISAIKEFTSVHNAPKHKPMSEISLSKLRSGEKGKGSPKSSRVKQEDSNENPSETTEQLHSGPNKAIENRAGPPNKSSTRNTAQSVRSVIEYKDVSDQIKINGEVIQGIVSLRLERDEVEGDTPR